MNDPFRHPSVWALLRAALDEDVGRGDWTSQATIPEDLEATAEVTAVGDTVVAGLPLVPVLFEVAGAPVEWVDSVAEGERVPAGTRVMALRAGAQPLLALERVLLNCLQRLSGIATETRRYAEAVAGTGATIVDTRKTVPGWRLLDKYAVRTGGGRNHRFGLDDGILIKDNHIVACGGIAEAVERARRVTPHLVRIEVECETLPDVKEAVGAGADAVLLDNMTTAEMKRSVTWIRKECPSGARPVIEASGGVTFERAREIAETGVNLISVGALTHSVRAADLSMALSVTPRP